MRKQRLTLQVSFEFSASLEKEEKLTIRSVADHLFHGKVCTGKVCTKGEHFLFGALRRHALVVTIRP